MDEKFPSFLLSPKMNGAPLTLLCSNVIRKSKCTIAGLILLCILPDEFQHFEISGAYGPWFINRVQHKYQLCSTCFCRYDVNSKKFVGNKGDYVIWHTITITRLVVLPCDICRDAYRLNNDKKRKRDRIIYDCQGGKTMKWVGGKIGFETEAS